MRTPLPVTTHAPVASARRVRTVTGRRAAPLLLALALVVALLQGVPEVVLAQEPPAADTRPPMAGQAASLLPPGNSGFVSVEGELEGQTGGSHGDNLDDQTALYWGLDGYAGQGFADPADAVRTEVLRDGAIRIHWDAFGVPAIHADTGRDVWYGAGYAIAQIRLFLMDAVRRQGRGTFAELVGPSGVPLDVQTRTLTYSDEEYEAIIGGLSSEARDAFEGYVEGANAWIAEVNADPELLPVEYALLSTRPEPLDLVDAVAAGVLITRTVAAEGGQEMDNVRLLRDLESSLGRAAGRGVFADLVWPEDPLAVTTVPAEEGRFPNAGYADLDEAFTRAADYAATLPLELAEGPGTGAFPEPEVTTLPVAPPVGPPGAGALLAARAGDALAEFASSLHGGSIAVALGPSRTADGSAMLLSGPQLGYSYPSLLVELEVQGGGYSARGASVPALPTVGIGYTDRVAWGLTTGYSKTIDSFIETVRGTPGVDLEHRFEGRWVPVDCRTEVVRYREGAEGLPLGPPARSVEVPVCRTVHGPIVAVQDGDGERLARSVTYQMFLREADTVEGVLGWNRARDLADFEAAMRLVTWNENTTYADADGHIAYWHPGIHRERPDFDLRFPMPGDGSAEFGDVLPFEALPHAVDPAQGFLANWNNKPALGWVDGIGIGPTSRPGGAVQRVSVPTALAASRTDHTLQTLQDLEVEAGLTDVRAAPFVPLLVEAAAASADADVRAVGALLAAWNGRFYDPPNAPTTFNGPGGGSSPEDRTDSPGATVFEAVLEALLDTVFEGVWGGRPSDPAVARACNSGTPGACPDLVSRQLGVGSHRYDASPAHNLLLRVLDPSTSGLTPSRDYLRGRSVQTVIETAVRTALGDLAATYGSEDLQAYRRPTHTSTVNSLTGVTGPSSVQPYMDRGSYIHVVGFEGRPTVSGERVAGPERVATSVAASAAAFPDGADTVVLASAGRYADALLAAPLTGLLDAPLLLVDGSLSPEVTAEIDRLGAGSVLVVGSVAAVAEEVEIVLARTGFDVRRIAPGDGALSDDPFADDAFALGAAVAAEILRLRGSPGSAGSGGSAGSASAASAAFADHGGIAGVTGAGTATPPDAYVVSATAFPDAIAIAGVAARTGTPVLMVDTETVPQATREALEALDAARTTIVGGTAVVGEAVQAALPGADRLAGLERYATAERVLRHARALGLGFGTLVLATGANFPDSLAGGAVADALAGTVVLVDGLRPEAPGAALAYARSQQASVERVVVLGGRAVVDDALVARPLR